MAIPDEQPVQEPHTAEKFSVALNALAGERNFDALCELHTRCSVPAVKEQIGTAMLNVAYQLISSHTDTAGFETAERYLSSPNLRGMPLYVTDRILSTLRRRNRELIIEETLFPRLPQLPDELIGLTRTYLPRVSSPDSISRLVGFTNMADKVSPGLVIAAHCWLIETVTYEGGLRGYERLNPTGPVATILTMPLAGRAPYDAVKKAIEQCRRMEDVNDVLIPLLIRISAQQEQPDATPVPPNLIEDVNARIVRIICVCRGSYYSDMPEFARFLSDVPDAVPATTVELAQRKLAALITETKACAGIYTLAGFLSDVPSGVPATTVSLAQMQLVTLIEQIDRPIGIITALADFLSREGGDNRNIPAHANALAETKLGQVLAGCADAPALAGILHNGSVSSRWNPSVIGQVAARLAELIPECELDALKRINKALDSNRNLSGKYPGIKEQVDERIAELKTEMSGALADPVAVATAYVEQVNETMVEGRVPEPGAEPSTTGGSGGDVHPKGSSAHDIVMARRLAHARGGPGPRGHQRVRRPTPGITR